MILLGLFVLFLLQIITAMELSHAGLQRMTFTSFSPKYWLQYSFLGQQVFPVFCFGLSACLSFSEGVDDVGIPYHHRRGDGSCSPFTTNHWFIPLPLNGSVRPSLHIYIVFTRLFTIAHRAERQEIEQRDATAQQETGTNPTHPHTHLYWCTRTTRKPYLFSNFSLPETFFCLAHNWLFFAFLTCWDFLCHEL